jgi:hypothetical protein
MVHAPVNRRGRDQARGPARQDRVAVEAQDPARPTWVTHRRDAAELVSFACRPSEAEGDKPTPCLDGWQRGGHELTGAQEERSACG